MNQAAELVPLPLFVFIDPRERTLERAFHEWLKLRLQDSAPQTDDRLGGSAIRKVPVGDDAAVVSFSDSAMVIATDTIAEGTHFVIPKSRRRDYLIQVGHKALGVSLSDMAAMGAKPLFATLNFQCPNIYGLGDVQDIFSGAEQLAKRFGVVIVGGDTNSWPGELVVTSTVIGCRPNELHGWSLGDAKPGDAIVVSGEFGGSIVGRHLTFEPRVELAQYLVENYPVHAATDVTDSLSSDAMAIATASRVGFKLDVNSIPVSTAAKSVDRDPLECALTDGEDFELIFTMPPESACRLIDDPNVPAPVTTIGEVLEGEAGLIDQTGNPINVTGYDH